MRSINHAVESKNEASRRKMLQNKSFTLRRQGQPRAHWELTSSRCTCNPPRQTGKSRRAGTSRDAIRNCGTVSLSRYRAGSQDGNAAAWLMPAWIRIERRASSVSTSRRRVASRGRAFEWFTITRVRGMTERERERGGGKLRALKRSGGDQRTRFLSRGRAWRRGGRGGNPLDSSWLFGIRNKGSLAQIHLDEISQSRKRVNRSCSFSAGADWQMR